MPIHRAKESDTDSAYDRYTFRSGRTSHTPLQIRDV